MNYLIEPSALETLRENANLAPSAADRLAFHREQVAAARVGALSVEGDVATINIEGVLTPKPDLLALLFLGGNTTYASIQDALNAARLDPKVRHVLLNVSSPGGTVAGLFETLEAIKTLKAAGKTVSVRSNFAASAAYAIAATAGQIDAVGEWATFGSVGVVATFVVREDSVSVASTNAPKKRPDVTTDEGKAIVREELDELHALFVKYIAEGRGLPTTADFGKGAVVMARKALNMNLIDSIGAGVKAQRGSDTGALAAQTRVALEAAARMGDDEAAAELLIRRLLPPSAGGTGKLDKGDQVFALMYPEKNKVEPTPPKARTARDKGDEVFALMYPERTER